jgi:hypothetical protein
MATCCAEPAKTLPSVHFPVGRFISLLTNNDGHPAEMIGEGMLGAHLMLGVERARRWRTGAGRGRRPQSADVVSFRALHCRSAHHCIAAGRYVCIADGAKWRPRRRAIDTRLITPRASRAWLY